MNNVVAVVSSSLELLTTIEVGLAHLRARMQEGHFEDSIYLFEDIVLGLQSIFEALQAINSRLPADRSLENTNRLLDLFDETNRVFQSGKDNYALLELINALVPAYAAWKKEIEALIAPFMQC